MTVPDGRRIDVSDKMQSDYSYEVTAPVGKDQVRANCYPRDVFAGRDSGKLCFNGHMTHIFRVKNLSPAIDK